MREKVLTIMSILVLVGCGNPESEISSGSETLIENENSSGFETLTENENSSDFETLTENETSSDVETQTENEIPPDFVTQIESEVSSDEEILPIGFKNLLPTCAQAVARISETVEVGITADQVRILVGRPRHVSFGWIFGSNSPHRSGPRVTFDARSRLVSGFSGVAADCDNSDISFIESVNSLIQTDDDTDYTDERPTCFDAATRIAANVKVGMSELEVRQLVGKPVEVDVFGWKYESRGFTASVSFKIGSPRVVTGYTTDCRTWL